MTINPLDLTPSLLILLIFILAVYVFGLGVSESFVGGCGAIQENYSPSTSIFDVLKHRKTSYPEDEEDAEPVLEIGEKCRHNDVCISKYCRRTKIKNSDGVCEDNYIEKAMKSKFANLGLAPMPREYIT
jgi:hypothetical protein